MDIKEVTGAVSERLRTPIRDDITTVHFGEADQQDIEFALADPKAFAAAAGVDTTEESQYNVSLLKRRDHHKLAGVELRARRARRPIIIIVHFDCCCGEIWVLGW